MPEQDMSHDMSIDWGHPGDLGHPEDLVDEADKATDYDAFSPVACGEAPGTPMADIELRIEDLNGIEVWIEDILSAGDYLGCTEEECGDDDPCCNGCSSDIGFRTASAFYPFDSMAGFAHMCRGDNCNPYGECTIGMPGQRMRVRAVVQHFDDYIALQSLEFCEARGVAPRRPDAFMSWQSPGGFAGHGPALVVKGNGTALFWDYLAGFDPDTTPEAPTWSLNLPPQAVGQLFERWSSMSTGELPHVGDEIDCYPQVYVNLCRGCEADLITYDDATQLEPEMEKVWLWFDAVTTAFGRMHFVRNYCRF
jgi:hypothetical protein